jgi:DNA-binding response OmpR family regulator
MSAGSTEPAVILIVDDDPIMLTGIATVLNLAGYECHGARDRQAALAAARTMPLDLVICDVNLAGDSGLELCRELRRQSGMDDVPVMFMSSAQIPDIVRRSHEAGGAYYLRKPFDPEVLIELVGKALWMPHLVQTRLSIAPAHASGVPAAPKMARVFEAIQGIQIPQA